MAKASTSHSLFVSSSRAVHIHYVGTRLCERNFYLKTKISGISGASVAHDVLLIESVLSKARIFESHDDVKMDNDFFWKFAKKPKNVGSKVDQMKETVGLTSHEKSYMIACVKQIVSPGIMMN